MSEDGSPGGSEAEPGEPDDTPARRLRASGIDLAGALSGAGAEIVFGDGTGTVVGAVIGVAITHAAAAVWDRLRGRQGTRAGATLNYLEADARARQEAGEAPRDDGFFEPRGDLRPEAEEVLEVTLLEAADAYEERKLPYLAHLFDGVAHDATISGADANALVNIAGQLSYRQLVALAVFADADDERQALALARATGKRGEGTATQSSAVESELDDLGARGLLGVFGGREGPAAVGSTYASTRPMGQQDPGALRLLDLGAVLHRLMRLHDIRDEDRDGFISDLARAPDRTDP